VEINIIMKKIILTTLVFLSGMLHVQSQSEFENPPKHKVFKQYLMDEVNGSNRDYFKPIVPFVQNKTRSVTVDYGNAPDWNWVSQFGGSGADYGRDIVTDDVGNVYITGSFSGEISINGNTHTSTGKRDAIVAKFDNSGNLVWLKQFSPAVDEELDSYGICLDDSENIYITGYYTGSVTLGSFSLPNGADYNLFFARLSPSGEVLMAKNHYSWEESEIGLKIDTDNSGNIYLLGSSSTYTDYRHPSIILKYNQIGNIIWEQYHDESFNDLVVFNSNIFFAALVENYNDGYIGNGIMLMPKGYGDAFIAKSNLNGDFVWASMGDHETIYPGDSYGTDLSVDESGDIYMAGFFRNEVVFGSSTLHTDPGEDGGFIVKCSSDGVFLWANQVEERAMDLSLDAANNTYILYNDNTENVGQLTKFNVLGNEQWTTQIASKPACLGINNSGNIFTTGTKDGLMFLTKMDNNAIESWQVHFNGDSGFGYVIGMASDNSGNLYTYAYASAEMDYFGETIQKGSFLSKQKGSGEIVWIKQFAGFCQNYGNGNYIAIDPSEENIFITGEFTDTFTLPGDSIMVPAEEGSIFIIKFGIDGTLKSVIQEDIGDTYGLCLAADYSGKIILSGTFDGEINIGGLQLISSGRNDVFVAKYNTSKNMLWAIKAGGEDNEWNGLISVDESDNIYFTGEFYSEVVTISNSQITMEEGDGNIIFAKLSPNGMVQWVTSKAGSTIPDYGDYCSWPTGIKADAQGYTYIKGWHGDSTYFDNFMLRSPYHPYSYFIAKFDPDGNTEWVNSITEHYYGFDYSQMDIDFDGSVFIGAQIRDTIHFGNDFDYVNVGGHDLFVAKYLTSGELDWVKIMESNIGNNWISSVVVYDTTNVFIGGHFNDFISFGDDHKYSSSRHGFVALVGEDISGFEEVYNRTDCEISICPNPFSSTTTIEFNNPNHSNYKLSVFDISGSKVFEQDKITTDKIVFEKGNLEPGIYILEIKGERVFRGKMVAK
jgi:type IX secretion system substrate protein/beta-propeller repeat-containing protein